MSNIKNAKYEMSKCRKFQECQKMTNVERQTHQTCQMSNANCQQCQNVKCEMSDAKNVKSQMSNYFPQRNN